MTETHKAEFYHTLKEKVKHGNWEHPKENNLQEKLTELTKLVTEAAEIFPLRPHSTGKAAFRIPDYKSVRLPIRRHKNTLKMLRDNKERLAPPHVLQRIRELGIPVEEELTANAAIRIVEKSLQTVHKACRDHCQKTTKKHYSARANRKAQRSLTSTAKYILGPDDTEKIPALQNLEIFQLSFI